jgi:hypothetical protein
MLSIKWKNKLSRKGFNTDIIEYDRWKDDDGNHCETFVNTENANTLYRIGNYITIAIPGGKSVEYIIEEGAYIMNTIEKFLYDWDVIVPVKDRSLEQLRNYFLEYFEK